MSLNTNSVGWGCKVEALKDMGLVTSDYDTLVDTVYHMDNTVELDRGQTCEYAHVVGFGNSDGYVSGGYRIKNSLVVK
mgnify:FL=1|tara:strand:+ start:699 stop:932 length:234 start_codon:yes stop_codon:yes gene_type:complete